MQDRRSDDDTAMEGRTFAERLTYSGVNMKGQFELEELEQLHKFLVKEITAQYGAPAAVKVPISPPSRPVSHQCCTAPPASKCHLCRSDRSWARLSFTWSSTAR